MLQLRTYLVKERVGVLKLTDFYDIFDPESGRKVGEAREEVPGWAKALRLLVSKRLMPTTVSVYDAEGGLVFQIRRGVALLRTTVTVRGADGTPLGSFQSKLLSLGGAFSVLDPEGGLVAQVKGDWKGWNFQLLTPEGQKLGTVAKKWAGLGKELFTSADTYAIALEDDAAQEHNVLLLAAGLAIDTVLKETA
jgi:uncharacterized protein YxjI